MDRSCCGDVCELEFSLLAGHKDAFVSHLCWEVNERRSRGGSEAASSACAWRAIRGWYCDRNDVSGLSRTLKSGSPQGEQKLAFNAGSRG